ncbi:hypothetical protein Salat_2142600 [Sesamum alatum]|uniref:Chromo domain-containing protein n=1 Tax=Sesamum alatum TaxID=300844 RepID=A0AAE1Y2A1_9LAMI|nr:hypothetical protein Salat_2142600 [Sesamum alatum]
MGYNKKIRRTTYLVHWSDGLEAFATWEKGVDLWQFEKELVEYWATKEESLLLMGTSGSSGGGGFDAGAAGCAPACPKVPAWCGIIGTDNLAGKAGRDGGRSWPRDAYSRLAQALAEDVWNRLGAARAGSMRRTDGRMLLVRTGTCARQLGKRLVGVRARHAEVRRADVTLNNDSRPPSFYNEHRDYSGRFCLNMHGTDNPRKRRHIPSCVIPVNVSSNNC